MAAHYAEHPTLIDAVRQLPQDCQSGKAAMSLDVMSLQRQWLRDHITRMDRIYAPHLAGAGVK